MKHHGITRIDNAESGFRGWRVCVMWDKKMSVKYFSDCKHKDSLKAAIDWRNKLWKKLGRPPLERNLGIAPIQKCASVVCNKKPIRGVFWTDKHSKVGRWCICVEWWTRHEGMRRKKFWLEDYPDAHACEEDAIALKRKKNILKYGQPLI